MRAEKKTRFFLIEIFQKVPKNAFFGLFFLNFEIRLPRLEKFLDRRLFRGKNYSIETLKFFFKSINVFLNFLPFFWMHESNIKESWNMGQIHHIKVLTVEIRYPKTFQKVVCRENWVWFLPVFKLNVTKFPMTQWQADFAQKLSIFFFKFVRFTLSYPHWPKLININFSIKKVFSWKKWIWIFLSRLKLIGIQNHWFETKKKIYLNSF